MSCDSSSVAHSSPKGGMDSGGGERGLLNVADAARLVGMASSTIRRWTADGRISVVKVGGQLQLRRRELERMVVRIGESDD